MKAFVTDEDVQINESVAQKCISEQQKVEKTAFKQCLDTHYGWLVVLASFLIQACSVGVASGFGVYVDYYSKAVFPEAKYTEISLIGTVAPTTIAFASMFTGRLCDRIGTRSCALLGAIVIAFSLVIGSFSTQVWHLVVTQGFLYGLGGALAYVPANTAVAHWFVKRRGLAFGIGTSGIGVGGLVFSLLNSYLLHEVGFNWTLRYNAIIIFVCLVVSAMLVKLPPKPTTDSENHLSDDRQNVAKPFSMKLILNQKFIVFGISTIFASFAYFIPLYYLPSYAVSKDLSVTQGANLVAIMNGASAAGRVFLGLAADRLGHLNVYLGCLLISTLTLVIWKFFSSYPLLILFSILYGIPSGGFAGGFPAACAALFGLENLASLMGFAYAFTGFGDLGGPLLAGFILDTTNDYNALIIYNISLYAVATSLFFIVKVILVDRLFMEKKHTS